MKLLSECRRSGYHILDIGQSIIPAYAWDTIKANVRFKIIFTIIKSVYEDESWWQIIIQITIIITIMENKYKEGEIVYSKIDPTLKLVIRRYVKRIYYCTIQEDPSRKELVYFERELMAVPSIWKNVHWLPAVLLYNYAWRPDIFIGTLTLFVVSSAKPLGGDIKTPRSNLIIHTTH